MTHDEFLAEIDKPQIPNYHGFQYPTITKGNYDPR